MEKFFVLGQNTWGIVPIVLRVPLFWFLILLGVILIGILLLKQKRKPPTPTRFDLNRMGGDRVFNQQLREHAKEATKLRIILFISVLLLGFASIRILGIVLYSETMQMTSQFGQAVTVPLATTVNVEGRDYTCSESKHGYVFTYQPQKGSLAVEAGPYLTNKTSIVTTFTPVWWGMQTKVTTTKVIYTCEA